MTTIAISTDKLSPAYAVSGRHFSLTQLCAFTILNQSYIDAMEIGTELAIKIKFYQSQMTNASVSYSNDVVSKFVSLISVGSNFSTLVKTYVDMEASKIPSALNNAAEKKLILQLTQSLSCLLYTSPSPRDATLSRMPSSA